MGKIGTVRVMLWGVTGTRQIRRRRTNFVPVKTEARDRDVGIACVCNVMFREAELPTRNVPQKLTADGLIEETQTWRDTVPLSATEGELDALLANKRLPVEDQRSFGSNWTLNELVWPA